jgi:hypothetical protein
MDADVERLPNPRAPFWRSLPAIWSMMTTAILRG